MSLYGFKKPDFISEKVFDELKDDYDIVLTRREGRWNETVENGNMPQGRKCEFIFRFNNGIVKRFCRKGIPSRLRSDV